MAYLITLALAAFAGGALRHWGAQALVEYRHGVVIQRRQRRRIARRWSGRGTPVGSVVE